MLLLRRKNHKDIFLFFWDYLSTIIWIMDKPSSIEIVLQESICRIRKEGHENGYDEAYINSVVHEFNETIESLVRKQADEKIVKFDRTDNS